jgi:two-component system sensor histidine kinase RpfC
MSKLASPGKALLERLRGRPDFEHEIHINRLVFSSVVTLYLVIATLLGFEFDRQVLQWTAAGIVFYYVATVLLLSHLLVYPGVSPIRRVCGIVLDMGILSFGLAAGDGSTALLYPIYLWAIFGNGFRFGTTYLFICAGCGVVGFTVAIVITPFWRDHPALSGGLLLALIILPAYVSVLIRKLNDALRQAEEASRAKSLFLASVSHELRTPLNAVIGFSELLEDTGPAPSQLEMIRTIGAAGRSLLGLINTLLDFARIEAGQMPLQTAQFDLHALLREVRRMIFVGAREKGVRVAVFVASDIPAEWVGPERDLREILTNLAGNALKFTARGHVSLSVRFSGDKLLFEIEDTGIGIAPEAQQRIFERFTQADETIVDRFGGTGLGLSIVQQLVARNGGRISVRSEVGKGSTFWFELALARPATSAEISPPPSMVLVRTGDRSLVESLRGLSLAPTVITQPYEIPHVEGLRQVVIIDAREPGWEEFALEAGSVLTVDQPPLVLLGAGPDAIASAERSRFVTTLSLPLSEQSLSAAFAIAAPATARSSSASGAATSGRSLRILVAEDNLVNKKLVARMLEVANHRVVTVSNGEEALHALADESFDIALLDVNMPVMNGLDAARLYRFSGDPSTLVPIVALTADATPEMEEKCAEAGMLARVTKPINRAELLHTIDTFARTGRLEVEAPAERVPIDMSSYQITNAETQAAIVDLGGEEFLRMLLVDFVSSATTTAHELRALTESDDQPGIRRATHSLSSSAGNVGAERIYRICEAWLNIPTHDQQEARRLVNEIARELAAFREEHAIRVVALRAVS